MRLNAAAKNKVVTIAEMAKTTPVRINKQGQALGRKGNETRERLMNAARRLLSSQSPVELTAVAIGRVAKTSSPTFYIYFNDIRDLLLSLGEAAGADFVEVHRILEEPWDPDNVEQGHAQRVVDAFNAVWNRHRDVLRFRNLEADRGDRAFAEQRIHQSVRIIDRFAERILAAYPKDDRRPRGHAYAEAAILHAAMESIAATDPVHVEQWQIGAARLASVMATMLARSFSAHPAPTTASNPPAGGRKKASQGTKR